MLSSFFKKGTQPLATKTPDPTPKESPSTLAIDLDPDIEELPPPPSSQVTQTSSPPLEPDSQPARPLKRKQSPSRFLSQTPAPSSTTTKSTKKLKVGAKSGQMKLSSFFVAPQKQAEARSKSSEASSEIIEIETGDTPTQQSLALSQSDFSENDHPFASFLNSSSQTTQTSLSNHNGSSSQSQSSKSAAVSWSTIMAPLVAPLCTVHGEPTKELTVNKPGPNKGKKFYVCSRFAVSQCSIP